MNALNTARTNTIWIYCLIIFSILLAACSPAATPKAIAVATQAPAERGRATQAPAAQAPAQPALQVKPQGDLFPLLALRERGNGVD